RIFIVPGCQIAKDGAGREQQRRQQKLRQIAAKDGGITPEQITQQTQDIDACLAVDGEIGTGDKIVQIALCRFAADESLSLVQIGSSAAIKPANLNRLLVIQRR